MPSYAAALEEKGFRITPTSGVNEALDVLGTTHPEVVILDAASMSTSGVRMCRTLRASLNGTPLILVARKTQAAQAYVDDLNPEFFEGLLP